MTDPARSGARDTAEATLAPSLERRPGPWARLRRNQLALLGLAVLGVLMLLALGAPLLPLYPPNATSLAERLLPPLTGGHLLGTDQLGRDLLSRAVWGLRVSLAVGAVATALAALVGSAIGLVAGFFGRWVDNTLMRGIDMLMAFPYLLLALAIVTVLGPGLLNALYAIAIVNIPFFARNVRGATVSLVRQEYVDAARLSGMSDWRILLGELLPNVLPVILITISTTLGWMVLETAGLSFLGLGAQPPQADLGSMLGAGREVFLQAPTVATVPGLVILLLVVSINLLGDGLRDVLDPRLGGGALMRPLAATEVALTPAAPHDGQGDAGALLTVERLSTRFFMGEQVYRAADDIRFRLQPGECVGLVGESGSGKSVTALSLLRLAASPPGRIVAGRVNLDGEDLLTLPLERLQGVRGNRVAYIFQDPLTTLNPLMPVGQQLAEAIRRHQGLPRRAAWARAGELLAAVHIPDAARRRRAYPHQLSGGMRQRVGIAMALANDPDVIIADEPTTALDVTTQAALLRQLDTLRRERGLALLYITHDFGVVEALCDRVLVMYAGQIVETGSVAELLRDPRHPYTRRLLDCVPRLGAAAGRREAIPGVPPSLAQLPAGCHFAERCDRVESRCRRAPIPLHDLGAGRASRCVLAEEGS